MFQNLPFLPTDPIFGLMSQFREDSRSYKVNLGVGIYSNPDGNPFVFPSVKKAAQELDIEDFNYQPIGGNKEFIKNSAQLALGDAYTSSGWTGVATCGGTQACRIVADLLKTSGTKDLLLSDPTWGNHIALFQSLNLIRIPHLDKNQNVDFQNYEAVLQKAAPESCLVLQGGQTHNPIGKNLSIAQLEELLPLIKKKNIFVFVDFAYLGMGENLAEDRKMLQFLWNNLEEMALGLSYSKNASLYEHRTGALIIKTNSQDIVRSQLENIIRSSISMAPGFGQEIMNRVFEKYQDTWHQELQTVTDQIQEDRKLFVEALPEFDYLAEGQGMFGMLPLSPDHIKTLRTKYGIYLVGNGRINFAGVKESNIEYIRDSLRAVI